MSIERLPYERRPRNSIANNLNRINELVDWVNQDTHLWASASGERVTVDDESSLKGLTVNGRSVQDGTPTPDAPVPVQVVDGPLSLVIGGVSVAINLQGNTLASLPDGTRDELHVDSAGHCVLTKRVGYLDANTSGSWTSSSSPNASGLVYMYVIKNIQPTILQTNTSSYCMSNLVLTDRGFNDTTAEGFGVNAQETSSGRIYWRYNPESNTPSEAVGKNRMATLSACLYYPLGTPEIIDLGFIDPPAIPSGSVVTVSASLTPTFHLEWWVDDGITELVDDIIAYVDYKTEG